MKIKFLLIILFIISIKSNNLISNNEDWGFYGHKKITRLAIFHLPSDLIGFYKKNIDFLEAYSVKPDMRRYVVKGEEEKHFIDLDHYYIKDSIKINQSNIFDIIPKQWSKAVDKYSKDTLLTYGIVQWNIAWQYYELIENFKSKNKYKILKTSSELGHYIADACVPLHTTENYNGQFTDQKGIHSFWETKLPIQFSDNYDFWQGKAFYIEDPLQYSWNLVIGSHIALDSVLNFDKILFDKYKEKKYSGTSINSGNSPQISDKYAELYNDMLDNMVERRMKLAIISIASYWYSAWLEAGSPDLSNIDIVSDTKIKELIIDSLLVDSNLFLNGRNHEN